MEIVHISAGVDTEVQTSAVQKSLLDLRSENFQKLVDEQQAHKFSNLDIAPTSESSVLAASVCSSKDTPQDERPKALLSLHDTRPNTLKAYITMLYSGFIPTQSEHEC